MKERRLNQDPDRIRRKRVAAGLEAQALARAAEISKSYLSAIEHGKANASPPVLKRIAKALECDIEDLMPEASTPVSHPDEARSA